MEDHAQGLSDWKNAQADVGELSSSDLTLFLRLQLEERQRQAELVSRSVSPADSWKSQDRRNSRGHLYDHSLTLSTVGYDVDIDDGGEQRAVVRANLVEHGAFNDFPLTLGEALQAAQVSDGEEEDDRPADDLLPLPGMTGPTPPEVAQSHAPDMYGRYFTAEHLRYVQTVMVGSVGIETARQYLASARHWNSFRGTIPEDKRPTEFLLEFTGQTLVQAIWVVLFARYGNEVHGFFGASLRNLITGLAFHFRCNHPIFDTRMFEEGILTKARKTFALPPAAACEAIAKQVDREKFPLPKEFLKAMRDAYWSPDEPLTFLKTADCVKMQAYVCLIYMLSWGSRAQNIVVTASRAKMLLNGTVVYTFLETQDPWVVVLHTGGGPARQYMRGLTAQTEEFDYSLLICVEYVVMVTKTINSTSAQAGGRSLEMPTTVRLVGVTPLERHAMTVMATWEVHAYGEPTDPVATVVHPTPNARKSQTNKAGEPTSVLIVWNGKERRCARLLPQADSLTKAFKAVAASEAGGGVDPKHISIGSARKFWASNAEGIKAYADVVAAEQGLAVNEVVRRLGGWAPGSRVMDANYTKARTVPSSFALLVPGAENGLLTGAQLNAAGMRRSLISKGAAGQGARGPPEAIVQGAATALAPTKPIRKSRARTTIVDVSGSEDVDVDVVASDPADLVTDPYGVTHDPALVESLKRAPVNFRLPFLPGVALRKSVLAVAPPRAHYDLGRALAAPPQVVGHTGQPVAEFKGVLYHTASRPPPEAGQGQYHIDLSRGYSLDCTLAFAEGGCLASGSNSAAGLVDPSGRVLASGDNNCHVAVDWTVAHHPRLYLYLTRPLAYSEAWTELMWPYGAEYIHSAGPLTEDNVLDFVPLPTPPTKRTRKI